MSHQIENLKLEVIVDGVPRHVMKVNFNGGIRVNESDFLPRGVYSMSKLEFIGMIHRRIKRDYNGTARLQLYECS
ncbi:MAG: hypothetical protein ACTSQY_09810 [Candidatus Odinarchaeia archaeon]